MGDRANVVVKDQWNDERRVVLYTHWGGAGLPAILKAALERGKDQWDDDQYLARVIFCEMLKNHGADCLEKTTGLGISAGVGDNEYPLLVVDCKAKTVHEAPEGDPNVASAGPWSFADYPGQWAKGDDSEDEA